MLSLYVFIFWFNFSQRYIAKHDLCCMQLTDSACKGIQRVTDNLLQQLKRISASLLQAAGRYQITTCNTFLCSRIFSILHAVSNTFWLFAKRRQTTFRKDRRNFEKSLILIHLCPRKGISSVRYSPWRPLRIRRFRITRIWVKFLVYGIEASCRMNWENSFLKNLTTPYHLTTGLHIL